MTTITLNLSPELEHQIRTEAARQGVEPDRYILNALQERLQPRLPTTQPTEADLLQQINIGFSAQTWEEYHAVIAKRHAETLTKNFKGGTRHVIYPWNQSKISNLKSSSPRIYPWGRLQNLKSKI